MSIAAVEEIVLKVISVRLEKRELQLNHRNSYREYRKAPRLYFWFRGESVLDHLSNRHSEPYKLVRKQVLTRVLKELKVSVNKIRWSQYAGCSCPCSPGFVLDGGSTKINGVSTTAFDIYLTLTS